VTDSSGEGSPTPCSCFTRNRGEKAVDQSQPPVAGDVNPAVSPDGRWLVFKRVIGFPGHEIYLLPLGKSLTAGGEPRRLTLNVGELRPYAGYLAWMPDRKEILYSTGTSLWRAAIPGDSPPARVPFVGENGIMPVVSRPQPGRPSGWSMFAAPTS